MDVERVSGERLCAVKIIGWPPENILSSLNTPECEAALKYARKLVPRGNKEIYDYQAAALFHIARDHGQGPILEIGTYYGYTAAIMALAAPTAQVITLNVLAWEVDAAQKRLAELRNVLCLLQNSRDYLHIYAGTPFSMIFVYGDHNRVKKDFPWWDKLAPGGLMLFHDYAPAGTRTTTTGP